MSEQEPVERAYLARALAERTSSLSASEVRALFAVASRPEVVSLAGGMPFISALPMDSIANGVRDLIATQGTTALQYSSGQGSPSLREQILEVMALEGIRDATTEDLVVTTGSQHALELLSKLLIDPGDAVIVEGPSYVTALVVFKSFQAQIHHCVMDEHGLDPARLRSLLESLRASNKRPKFLYTIPNFNNPAGVTLALERRSEILKIATEHELLVIEDNPYGLLYFSSPPPNALRSVDPNVIYLGTFSKTFAPGLRVGWALAPKSVREKLILANEAAVLSPSAFNQAIVDWYLRHEDWRTQVDKYRTLYRERKQALISALATSLPNCNWTDPDGGFYVWLTLPEGLNSRELLPDAVKAGVAYTPGTAFFADGQGEREIRLSFCLPNPTEIAEGVRRLAKVVTEKLRANAG